MKVWTVWKNLFVFLFRNMYCVWRAYLEGTVQVTQSRISACENYKVQVADPAKTVRLQKEQQLRKVTGRSLCSGFSRWCEFNHVTVCFHKESEPDEQMRFETLF